MMQSLMVRIQNALVKRLGSIIIAVEVSCAAMVRGLRAAVRGVKRFF